MGARSDPVGTLAPERPDVRHLRTCGDGAVVPATLGIAPTGPGAVRSRALAHLFPPADLRLVATVVVPARDEAARLPRLVAALAAQLDADGRPFAPGHVDVLVLLNNTTDDSAAVLGRLAADHPALAIHAASVTLAGADAHVGRARQLLMDAAWARLDGSAGGLILSTDADTAPAPDWIAATQAAVAAGADAVGGRALLLPDERCALPPGVRRLYLLDLAYRRALEEMKSLFAPDAHDPFPRHHHHFGASLAVSAAAYGAVGGLPAQPTSEDVALVYALTAAGFRLRHSDRVRVFTSARATGRADGGLADAFVFWDRLAASGVEPTVEPAACAERRLQALGRARTARPGLCLALAPTPEAAPGASEPLPGAIAGLRQRIARLRPLPLDARLSLPPLP